MRGLSIQERLPLLICFLLLAVMLTFAWISYYSVKKANIDAGKERLSSLTETLATLFTQSAQNTLGGMNSGAHSESIRKFVKSNGNESYSEVSDAIQTIRKDSNTIYVEITDKNGKSLIKSGRSGSPEQKQFDTLFSAKVQPGVGKFKEIKGKVYYSLSVPITDKEGILGYVTRWRLQSASAKAIEQFTNLIGAGSKLYVSNVDGSLWSNLQSVIDHPKIDTAIYHQPALYTSNDGKEVMGSSRRILGTPWQVTVEVSASTLLAPARDFLRWITLVGGIILVVGIFLAWIMSLNLTRPLNKLTSAASAIANGHHTPVSEVSRTDEVGKLARAFNAMSEQVNKAKTGLEKKVIETEEINNQLRELSAHLQNIREQERIHIAREMHDELGQLLTGFKMDVSWLSKKIGNTDDPVIKEKLVEMMSIVDESVKFVRRIAAELRPGVLDDLGLIAALDWHSKEFEKRFKIKIDFKSSVEELKAMPNVATGLFRMYQESLTNVARHSHARNVDATLDVSADEIRLSIKDDGKGFDTKKSYEGNGLNNMHTRAADLGATLTIDSQEGAGTQIHLEFNFHPAGGHTGGL